MSLITEVNKDILSAFQNAAAGIHAQFANTLKQAGHNVSEENTASQLLNVAATASNTVGKPATGIAPNYADFALQGFLTSMEQIAVQFAAAHLPDKLKPVMAELSGEIQSALGGQPVNTAGVVEDVTEAAGAVAVAVDPAAAPIVAVAEPIAKEVEAAVLAPASEAQSAAAPVQSEVAAPAAVDPEPSKASLLSDDTH